MIRTVMDLARVQSLASAGDADAQAELIRTYYPRVRKMVHQELDRDFRRHHRWILPMFSTGDIVQEVFVGVIRDLDRFEGDGEDAFVRFLATLVKHRLVDAVRFHESARRDVRRNLEADKPEAPVPMDADPTPSLVASVAEQIATFREVLESLPLRERSLLELRLVETEPYAVIAERLGYPSADAVRKAFRSAQARLLVALRRRGVRAPDETGA